ncbi:hypothetical protein Cni_G07193 [Canna indica]|uniref:Core-2/I-branching beta-1,6-N-acetylglucosaminyltransferase family protein n=1 Tax=Canna indica TaxID=4628 RepID=A0AAQ3JYP5_9LILI|nr:hypothetical protein Cni_G07193 [Canna indica]
MKTNSSASSSTPRHKKAVLHSFHLKKMQSKVCSPDDVTVLIKIFGVLLLLLVLVISVATYQQIWSSHEDRISYRPPPANLMHNMSDEQLFRHALSVSRMKDKYRSGGSRKIAFMFLTAQRMHLTPLWDQYFEGHEGLYSIYIHSEQGDYALNSVFYRRQIPSRKVSEKSSFSAIDAARRLLANALLDLSNERFVLLSETCIPLYNYSFTYDYLINSKLSFVEAFDEPGPGARGRYSPKLAPELSLSQWRKGAPWFEVHRTVAVAIVNDTELYAKFDRLRDEMNLQHEHYFPSLLTLRAERLIANRSVTWESWKSGAFEPEIFELEDTTRRLLEKINMEKKCVYDDKPSTVCFLFARRFGQSSLWPLLKLASSLGFASHESS